MQPSLLNTQVQSSEFDGGITSFTFNGEWSKFKEYGVRVSEAIRYQLYVMGTPNKWYTCVSVCVKERTPWQVGH